jgi:hypothetical protein
MENSKTFELDELEFKLLASDEPTPPFLHSSNEFSGQSFQKETVEWTDGIGSGSSDALGFDNSKGRSPASSAPDDPMLWPVVYPTHAFKSYRDAPKHLLQHRMNQRLQIQTSGSSDAYVQTTQYCTEWVLFSTGWSDGASVQCVDALSGLLGSTAISAPVSDHMIRC